MKSAEWRPARFFSRTALERVMYFEVLYRVSGTLPGKARAAAKAGRLGKDCNTAWRRPRRAGKCCKVHNTL
jgi:hypothetical protein